MSAFAKASSDTPAPPCAFELRAAYASLYSHYGILFHYSQPNRRRLGAGVSGEALAKADLWQEAVVNYYVPRALYFSLISFLANVATLGDTQRLSKTDSLCLEIVIIIALNQSSI